jgi:hypothetical protein
MKQTFIINFVFKKDYSENKVSDNRQSGDKILLCSCATMKLFLQLHFKNNDTAHFLPYSAKVYFLACYRSVSTSLQNQPARKRPLRMERGLYHLQTLKRKVNIISTYHFTLFTRLHINSNECIRDEAVHKVT